MKYMDIDIYIFTMNNGPIISKLSASVVEAFYCVYHDMIFVLCVEKS